MKTSQNLPRLSVNFEEMQYLLQSFNELRDIKAKIGLFFMARTIFGATLWD